MSREVHAKLTQSSREDLDWIIAELEQNMSLTLGRCVRFMRKIIEIEKNGGYISLTDDKGKTTRLMVL